MNLETEYRNLAAEYVRLAILAMRVAATEAELIEWWRAEQTNRNTYRLSPHQWPGLDLKEAFDARRKELK